ncbi:MAG: biotin--[acetyl-CoA-carboxylase] ligase [Ruminococcaceae bacterium]|nr:biotin--[acetyl-CoA-carboxylase] ligase [Oscillospiraceae bacterium]
MDNKIIYLNEVDSTNIFAADLCRNSENLPTAVVAESQFQGSGRMGRKFFSPQNDGIYMTYILDVKNVKTLNLITSSAGLAVAEVLENLCKVNTNIKWPNDIIISSKKVCGILTKLITEKTEIRFALIGIGINVTNEKFPDEIKDIATSLKIETGKVFNKKEIIESLVEKLDEIFIEKIMSEEEIVEKIKLRSCMLNKKVFVKSENKEYFAVDISPDGGLVVHDDGKEKVIHNGEVELF